ncbi:carotenoid oxygenase family protein [uncultured Rhodoblastus sp.]|uniref:8'-apo-carotenoid 13,14-cleaving dioxygenase n=1 Tax=uncultured Rhodoblastus sp. TaxID=543037 RepID=UPI0025ED7471|nr:carotenoid oxygenase family protein [uncultured Rhodoblastus sp.]
MASQVESFIRKVVAEGAIKVAEFNRWRPRVVAKANPFLIGIHEPLGDEATLENPEVTGTIPPELDGCYLRNGPNPIEANPATYHWFLGDGMIHGLRLKHGKAQWYKNRWVRTSSVSKALGEPPAPGTRNGRFDTVNTNILGHAGKIWALVEAGGFPVEIDGDLETVAHNPFAGTLHGAFTAHPHVDPDTGEMHAICYDAQILDAVRYVVVGADGRVRRDEKIAVEHGPSIHDCAITENYVIVLDLPVTFSMKSLLAGQDFPYAWNPKHRARVGLLPRKHPGELVWCEVAPCYVFHPANAYERADGKIVFDACVHDTMFAQNAHGPVSARLAFERWTIDPVTRRVNREVIDPDAQEFPRIDQRRTGKPYRFAYALAVENGSAEAMPQTRLFKHDLETGRREVHDFGPNRLPGEFTFVPRSAGSAEDDGWLMGFVLNAKNGTADFVVLDAQNFAGPPQAEVHLARRIPPGFHGNWVASGTG